MPATRPFVSNDPVLSYVDTRGKLTSSIGAAVERKAGRNMAAGRTLGKYTSDLLKAFDNTGATVDATFAVDVPNNLFGEASLGWSAAAAGEPRLPRRLKPRHVIGLNAASGRRARVIVASLTATLWTGVANTWTSIQNDGTSITYTVTGRVGEAATIVG